MHRVAAQAHGILNSDQMIRLAAFLTVAVGAFGNKTMLCMAVGAFQFAMFARILLQCLRWPAVAAKTLISGNIGDIKRAVGVRMTVAASSDFWIIPVR